METEFHLVSQRKETEVLLLRVTLRKMKPHNGRIGECLVAGLLRVKVSVEEISVAWRET